MRRTDQQIQDELQRLATLANELDARYAGQLAMHRAACIAADKDELLERRQALHVTLDRLLDNGEALQALAREAHTRS